MSPEYALIQEVIDATNVEWWPFIEFEGYSWIYGYDPQGPYLFDWMVVDGVTLTVCPEPCSLVLLAGGLGLLVARRRRR